VCCGVPGIEIGTNKLKLVYTFYSKGGDEENGTEKGSEKDP
jgi:hypothetical protein